jgi:hypothetical protein
MWVDRMVPSFRYTNKCPNWISPERQPHACGERLERAFGDFWMLAIPDNLMQK